MILHIIVAILAALMFLEGLIIVIAPKQSVKLIKKILKKQKKLRTIGLIEAIAGILILLLMLYY